MWLIHYSIWHASTDATTLHTVTGSGPSCPAVLPPAGSTWRDTGPLVRMRWRDSEKRWSGWLSGSCRTWRSSSKRMSWYSYSAWGESWFPVLIGVFPHSERSRFLLWFLKGELKKGCSFPEPLLWCFQARRLLLCRDVKTGCKSGGLIISQAVKSKVWTGRL